VEGKEAIDFFERHKNVGACLDENGHINSRPTSTTFADRRIQRHEGPFDLSSNKSMGKYQSIHDLNIRVIEAMRDPDDMLIELLGSWPFSNPLHTDFAIQQLRKGLADVEDSEWLNSPVKDLTEVPSEMKKRLQDNGIKTRDQLLEYPLEHLQQKLHISNEEVRDLYLNAWDIPSQSGQE